MKNNIKKKQHYYPKFLMRYFANEDGKLYTYIRTANKTEYLNYTEICAEKYFYETDEVVDNILENKLSVYESKMALIVDKIMKEFNRKLESEDFTLKINLADDEIDFIFKYLWMQYLRTNRGKTEFIRETFYKNYTSRKVPLDIDEIQESKNREILAFNRIFKVGNNLEEFFERFKKPDFINFHIVIGKKFITSDNPVIGFHKNMKLCMPISKNIYLEFTKSNSYKHMIKCATEKQEEELNRGQIITANYFVISKEEFDMITDFYIYRRFQDSNFKENFIKYNNNIIE